MCELCLHVLQAEVVYLYPFYGLSYYGFKSFRSCPPGIAQIDFMVQAFSGEIRLVSVFREKGLHLPECAGSSS